MTLAVVAYPRMEPESLRVIESFRASNDPLARFIDVHMTLVFPAEVDPAEVARELRAIAASAPGFAVSLFAARASVGIDGRSYALLEPDSGGELVSRLHDRLYSGMLARHLRADVAYEPHVTVGSCDDRADCERMAREFNRLWSPSSAHIDGLVLLDVDGPRARELGVFALAGANRVAGA